MTHRRKIWLITVGEPLPIGDDQPRLHRVGLLAKRLSARGEEVVLWSSTMDHQKKAFHASSFKEIQLSPQLQLKLLHGTFYDKNISFKRLLNHHQLGKRFKELAPRYPKPDVIVASYPTIELCAEAVHYGREHQVPVIIDIRDLWPDIFLEKFPGPLEPVGRLLLRPLFKKAQWIMKHATSITGCSPAFVQWGLEYAKRLPKETDRSFFLAYPKASLSLQTENEGNNFWETLKIQKEDFIVSFIGSITSKTEAEILVEAARILQHLPRIKFVVCGQGDKLSQIKQQASGLQNILFPGWINQPQIVTLMQRASVAILPYPSSNDFCGNFPNKAGEYLSGSLPILSSINGALKTFLQTHQCGFTYENHKASQLTDFICQLFYDPEKLKEMKKNAYRTYQDYFNEEIVYDAYCDYILDHTH